MKKLISILIKVLLVSLVVIWISLIVVEYFRQQNDKPMLLPLYSENIEYYDGNVEIYYGLGYKSIIYKRISNSGKEFGHMFIKVREEI